LDLGEQPPADLFPLPGDPSPDPAYPLRMAVCDHCGLAQLVEDPTLPEEARGQEPAALVAQAAAAVAAVAESGLLPAGARFAEFDSPHGGSWRGLLSGQGAIDVSDMSDRADVVVDVFSLMHAADQTSAMHSRVDRLTNSGLLLLQYHPLHTIVQAGQWNALRHGHMAYYSTSALTGMLAQFGLTPGASWSFPLYGGTVLLAAWRDARPDAGVRHLLTQDETCGATTAEYAGQLQKQVLLATHGLRDWLVAARHQGRRVFGYGAASRAVPLLVAADVGPELLPAIADAAESKWGRTIPGVRIPIISPTDLIAAEPDSVLLFVPDLLPEVRRALPQIAEWMVAEPVVAPAAE